jgi:hypothetical protein
MGLDESMGLETNYSLKAKKTGKGKRLMGGSLNNFKY